MKKLLSLIVLGLPFSASAEIIESPLEGKNLSNTIDVVNDYNVPVQIKSEICLQIEFNIYRVKRSGSWMLSFTDVEEDKVDPPRKHVSLDEADAQWAEALSKEIGLSDHSKQFRKALSPVDNYMTFYSGKACGHSPYSWTVSYSTL